VNFPLLSDDLELVIAVISSISSPRWEDMPDDIP